MSNGVFAKKIEINFTVLIAVLIVISAAAVGACMQYVSLHKVQQALQAQLEAANSALVKANEDKTKLTTQRDELNAEINELNLKTKQLQELLNTSDSDKKALQTEIDALKSESAKIKEEIRLWEGKIGDLDEVDAIQAKRNKAAIELRQRIRELKRQAQDKIDKLKSEFGNKGYAIKQGQPTPSWEKDLVINAKTRGIELKKIIVRPSN